MIDLIKNAHTFAMCGKKLAHIGDMTEHMNETNHNEHRHMEISSLILNIFIML